MKRLPFYFLLTASIISLVAYPLIILSIEHQEPRQTRKFEPPPDDSVIVIVSNISNISITPRKVPFILVQLHDDETRYWVSKVHDTLFHVRTRNLFFIRNPIIVFIDSELEAGASGYKATRIDVSQLVYLTHLDERALRNWSKPRLILQIFTFNRLASLKRLMNSLLDASYPFDERIDVQINVEALADQATIDYVSRLKWTHGDLRVRQRVVKGGLLAQITESWYPLSNDEYAIFLEDDIEVSPLYFIYYKLMILHYRYSLESEKVYGVSLFTPRAQELFIPKPKMRYKGVGELFMWMLPCSWGAVYYPEHWIRFIHYLRIRVGTHAVTVEETTSRFTSNYNVSNYLPPHYDVIIPLSRSNEWKNSWKKFFVEYAVIHGVYMIYPNYPNQASFSTNHLEPGAHISQKHAQKKNDYEVPLVQEWKPRLLHWNQMIRMDIFGNRTQDDFSLRKQIVIRNRNIPR